LFQHRKRFKIYGYLINRNLATVYNSNGEQPISITLTHIPNRDKLLDEFSVGMYGANPEIHLSCSRREVNV
jgi:hypothetical protein